MSRGVPCFVNVFAASNSRLQCIRQAFVRHCQVFVLRDVVAVAATGLLIVLWADAMHTQEITQQPCGFQTEHITF